MEGETTGPHRVDLETGRLVQTPGIGQLFLSEDQPMFCMPAQTYHWNEKRKIEEYYEELASLPDKS